MTPHSTSSSGDAAVLPGVPLFFHDTSVLVNFHRPGLVPVLGALFGENVRWTATIRRECERQEVKLSLPGLVVAADALLDLPTMPEAGEHLQIRQLRTLMASPQDHPDEHWGEAETITIIQRRRIEAVLVTDDRGAQRWAAPIRSVGTWRLIRLAVRRGDASIDDAIRLWRDFCEAGSRPPLDVATQDRLVKWVSGA